MIVDHERMLVSLPMVPVRVPMRLRSFRAIVLVLVMRPVGVLVLVVHMVVRMLQLRRIGLRPKLRGQPGKQQDSARQP